MKSTLSVNQKIAIVSQIKSDWSATNSNTYVGIGHVKMWSAMDAVIPDIDTSVDGFNTVFDNLIAIKKISDSDMSLVVPRVDWANNTTYDAYDNTVDMFSKNKTTKRSGNVQVFTSNTSVVGTNTSFVADFVVGNHISYYNFSNGITEDREVISVSNNTFLTINSAFTYAVTSNTYHTVVNEAPNYALDFYVRNSVDQVFICVFNNSGALSTQMPQISLGGNLPQNPYIQTADGYKWKYLYTIPSGVKAKFFTTDWMPVLTDTNVQNAVVDGRIDIIKILNGGVGYNQNVVSSNATIITITGDGTGANATAVVSANGTITDLNILSGGSGYTYANVVATAGLTGSNAAFDAVIPPHNGHGFNPVYDLGATNLMVCLELVADEGGAIPVLSSNNSDTIDYHQISIIQNPRMTANVSNVASGSVYNLTTGISTGPLPAGSGYTVDDTAFQGVSLDVATFFGTIVNWDSVNNKVYLNNIRGTFVPFTSLRATQLGANITAFAEFPPLIKVYTGEVLYVENRASVSRSPNQTEQIKLIIEL